jgi:hypothetical protein
VPVLATLQGHAYQTLHPRADLADDVQFLINHVSRHSIALKQKSVEAPEIAVDPVFILDFLNAIDRRGLALIEELRLFDTFELFHFAHQIVAQRR